MQNHTHTSGGVCVPCIYMHAMQVTVGDSGLCCCAHVMSFERRLTPLCVDSYSDLQDRSKHTAKYPNLLLHGIHEVVLARSDNLSVLLHVLGQTTSVSCCMSWVRQPQCPVAQDSWSKCEIITIISALFHVLWSKLILWAINQYKQQHTTSFTAIPLFQ